MVAGELSALLLVLAPVAGGAVSLLAGPRKAQSWIVGATAAVAIVAAAVLFGDLAGRDFAAMEIFGLDGFGIVIEALGLVLGATFLYLGWRTRSILVAAFAVGDIIALLLLSASPHAPSGPIILIDTLALIMLLITSMIGSVIAVYSLQYMRDDPRRGRFLGVILLFLAAMNAAVMSNDLRWFEVFWSVTTLFSFLLISHPRTDESRKAARLALIINTGGGLALLVGALLVERNFGTYMLSELPVGGVEGLALLPFALIAIGAFTKSAQVPFQSWLLGAMVAPTPVSALLHSSTMVNLGVFLLLRISSSIQGSGVLAGTIAVIGGVSFLVTSVLAMTQSNSKRVLAYSTVGNLGLVVMCAGIATPLALAAAVVLLLYHAISKALLFLAVGAVKEGRHSEDIEDMHGLRKDMPLATLALLIGVATLVLPPFGMFVSKWLISEAAIAIPLLAFLLAVGFATIVVYYAKWMGVLLSTGPEKGVSLADDPSPRLYRWTLGALGAGAVAVSVLVGPVIEFLVRPFVQTAFALPPFTETLDIFTAGGELQAAIFLMLAAVVLIGVRLFLGPRQELFTTPYACGEDFEFQAAGEYYLSECWVGRLTKGGNLLGAVLLAVLVLAPFVLEAL